MLREDGKDYELKMPANFVDENGYIRDTATDSGLTDGYEVPPLLPVRVLE